MPEIISPIDGQPAYHFDLLDPMQIRQRVELASATSLAWREESIESRIAVCRGMLQCYAKRLDQNAEEITRMMGKPLAQARGEFERTVVERVEALCELAPAALADERLPDQTGLLRFIRREPVGVVLDIAAWNYPLAIAVNVIVPAVLAGNSVLVKHASQTALVADQFERAFLDAGAPAGLVQATPMSHETTADLIQSRALGYVSFTGSVRGGHQIYQNLAQNNFIQAGMELGGKDPALVLEDADIAFASENLVDGAFYNAGQSCCGIERIYVAQEIFDDFLDAFLETTRQYNVGNPLLEATTLGPVVDQKSAAFISQQIDGAQKAGAQLLLGEADFHVPDESECYLAPHVLIDTDHSMNLMHEETFGPAIGIMKVANESEGLALMNDSEFGLTASIWSGDFDRASRLSEDVLAGTVFVNRCDYLDPRLAWTGIKDSGFGCSLSSLGFASVTRPKSYHLRQQPNSPESPEK